MNRRVTNAIRFLLDECLPPVIRDSRWFMFPFYVIAYRGRGIRQAMNFKRDVMHMSSAEFAAYYAGLTSISRDRATDTNDACLGAIMDTLTQFDGARVLDAGCGNGHVLRLLSERFPRFAVTGLDIIPTQGPDDVALVQGELSRLPFTDGAFDVVICSHTLEHCLDLQKVVGELKRVCRHTLIVVGPRQRPYFYTLDEHVQFFFYEEQLIHALGLAQPECRALDGDWFCQGRV